MAKEGLPYRKRLYHDVPSWVSDGASYFLTINSRPRGKDQLCHDQGPHPVASAILESVRLYHERGSWFVHRFLLMPDHAHAILAFSRDESMSALVRTWKGYQKRSLGVHWQEGFFDHRLRTEVSLAEKDEYIRMNPVRKGLCDRPEDWPHVLRFGPNGQLIEGRG